MHPKSFSSAGDDTLFLQTCINLDGPDFSVETLEKIWKYANEHFDCLFEFMPEFCSTFKETDRVDISVREKSFYVMVLAKNWIPGNIPAQIAEKFWEFENHEFSPAEIQMFNIFINAMIQDQRDFIVRINS